MPNADAATETTRRELERRIADNAIQIAELEERIEQLRAEQRVFEGTLRILAGEPVEPIPEEGSGPLLREMVEEVVFEMEGEFDVTTVVERLAERSVEFAASDRSASVSSALRRMAEKGVLEVVTLGKRGRGNSTVYRCAGGRRRGHEG